MEVLYVHRFPKKNNVILRLVRWIAFSAIGVIGAAVQRHVAEVKNIEQDRSKRKVLTVVLFVHHRPGLFKHKTAILNSVQSIVLLDRGQVGVTVTNHVVEDCKLVRAQLHNMKLTEVFHAQH